VIVTAAFAISIIADLVFSLTWTPAYFRTGLLLYSRRFPARPASNWPLPPHELEDEFYSPLAASYAFRSLSPREYAFREHIVQLSLFRYTPLMHGLLDWNFVENHVLVTGRANWFPSVLYAFGVAGSLPWTLERGALYLVPAILITAVFGGIFAIQAYRYTGIGRYAAGRWSDLRAAYGADA
jgi:hypothetical protein